MPVGGGVKLEIILSLLKTFTMLDSSNPSPMCILCSIHIHMNSPRTFKCYIYCFVLQSLLLPPLLLSSHYSCFLRGLCNPASPLAHKNTTINTFIYIPNHCFKLEISQLIALIFTGTGAEIMQNMHRNEMLNFAPCPCPPCPMAVFFILFN